MNKQTMGIYILLAVLLAACGSKDEGVGVAPPVPEDREEVEEPELAYAMLLQAVDELPLGAPSMSTTPVRVQLLDAETLEPVGDEPVTFEVLQAPEGTTLAASSTTTTPNGGASVELRVGAMGTGLIEVTHPEAAPLMIDIHVTEPPNGDIRVDIIEPTNAPVTLDPFRLSFFPTEEFACDEFIPLDRLPDAVHEQHAPNADEPVLVEGFDGPMNYTVVVEALGSAGRPIATGCTDGIGVSNGNTTAATVHMDLLPVSPSGTYTVDGEWDIAPAVSSANSTTGTLVGVIDFMADPGASIYDLVITEIEDAIDFPIGIVLGITGIRQQIIDYVNGQLFQIDGLDTFVAISNDLSNMLHNLQVTSLLEITKTDIDYNFAGHEEWTAITVNWTWRCQNSNDPNCGVHTLDLTGADAAAAHVEYDWLGQVEGYDDFVVNSHEATLDVGQLQMYLLEKVIIPEITGGAADSLGGALAHWVDCADLAQQAINGNDICDPTGIFCVGETLIQGACSQAMNEVANQIMGPIENQSVVLDIEMAGTARLVDTTSNGLADELVEGSTEGTLQGTTEPVKATWTAVKYTE